MVYWMGQMVNLLQVYYTNLWPRSNHVQTIAYNPEFLDFKLNAVDLGWLLVGDDWLLCEKRSREVFGIKADWSRAVGAHYVMHKVLCVSSPASLVGWGHVTGFWPNELGRITPCSSPAPSSPAVVTMGASPSWRCADKMKEDCSTHIGPCVS